MKKPLTRQGRYTRVTRTRRAKRTARRHVNWFWRLDRKHKAMVIAAPILAFLILTPIITYLVYANDIKDPERLMNRNNTGIVLTDMSGKEFYSVGKAAHRNQVPLDQISKHVKEGLIATEDKDFYRHGGFNIGSIFRAIFTNLSAGSMNAYGGSTLTQQLAKNTLLSDNKSFMRKYQELAVSIAIEQNYTKDEILNMYLNSVYYGENSFGIEEASKAYFNKAPKDLDLAESAMLVGILPAPSAYSPISGNMEYAKERQQKVLTRMVAEKYITEADKTAALAQELAYGEGAEATQSEEAPHFAEMVIKELSDKYGYEKVMRSGYQVKTTLDLGLQQTLKSNVENHIRFIQANGGSNAASVAIDPKTGEIRALVGSADWKNEAWGKVNVVTRERQPGSSFKPIYYAKALEAGSITPATVMKDEPLTMGNWKPQNADRRFRGDVSIRSALSQSLNIPSIKVMQKYGVSKSAEGARELGINSIKKDKEYDLTLSLGSGEATPLEMTNAYAAFANQGNQFRNTTINQINDKFNKKIYAPNEKSKKAIGEAGAFLISSILSDNSARAPIFGGSLTVSGHTAAVKTGTTNDNRDAWTIGYTPSIALGVWVGNNDNEAMANGGSGMAGPIWRNTMSEYLRGKPDEKFVVPSSVVQRYACKDTGGLASGSGYGTYQEYFKAGSLPGPCEPKEEPKVTVCDVNAKQIVSVTESEFNDNQSRYSKDTANCETRQIRVCDTAAGAVVTIDEDAFDSTKYSRDTANCKKKVETISACNLSTGRIEQVDPLTYNRTTYTTDYVMEGNKCVAPSTGGNEGVDNTTTP